MKKNSIHLITTVGLLTLLTGCATQVQKPPLEANDPLSIAQKTIAQQLDEVGKTSGQTHSFNKVSDCRYELTTSWQNLEKGFYKAKSSQRFSFTHDIRNIELTPAYSLLYEDGMQYWDDMLDLTFNRMIPTQFSYVKTGEYQNKQRTSESDAFSINVSGTRATVLLEAFEQLARLCGNDTSKNDAVAQKLLGRWEVFGLERPEGAMIVTPNEAGIIGAENVRVEGPYTISQYQDYHLLTITPKDGGEAYSVLVDFVNSNYARLLMLAQENPEAVPFAPVWSEDVSLQNPDEKKLFRKGDLR